MKKRLLVVGISVLVFILLLISAVVIYINTNYHNEFIDNFLYSIGIDNTDDNTKNIQKRHDDNLSQNFELSRDPIALNDASNSRYARYDKGILVVNDNLMTLYSNSGKTMWSVPIQISEPILKVSGNKILIAEENGKKFELYSGKKSLYKKEIENNIINANLSSDGDVTLVTEMDYYKGSVSVYNKSGEEIFLRNFGSDSVLVSAISKQRKLAVSLLSVNERVNSKIVFLDINKTDDGTSKVYENTLVYDLDFSGETLFAYCDDKILALNKNGKEKWREEFGEKNLYYYNKDTSNNRLLLLDNSNEGEFILFNTSGISKKMKTDIIPVFCDVNSNKIIYNDERNIYLSKTNGDHLAKYTASRDIYKVFFIDSKNVLVVYNSSIEFLKIK